MLMVQHQVKGLKEIQAAIAKSPEISRPIFAKAINAGLAIIDKVAVEAGDPYGGIFQFKNPRSRRTGVLVLSFGVSGSHVFATESNLAGAISPQAYYAKYVYQNNPFMDRIMDKARPSIDKLFAEALSKVRDQIANSTSKI